MNRKDYTKLLGDLGTNPNQVGVIQFDSVIGRALYVFANGVMDVMKSVLTEQDAYYSNSELLQSLIVLPVTAQNKNYIVVIEGNDYAFFVDKGVSGTRNKFNSPYSFRKETVSEDFNKSLRRWITKRGIPLETRYSRTRNLTKQQRAKVQIDEKTKMAYAIGRKVKQQGIKPTLFITKAVDDQQVNSMGEALGKALGASIQITLANNIKQIVK